MSFNSAIDRIARADPYNYMGKIDKIVGMMVESVGPTTTVGELCRIHNPDGGGSYINAEVVGFRENRVLLMPYEDLSGISPGSLVEGTKTRLKIPVSDALIGRTVDALGRTIDEMGPLSDATARYEVESAYANPLSRPRIDTVMTFGVKAIDSVLTIGKGQRMGIFAGSGVGKSTLMGMIARNVHADINVIALVGERGREVLEFIQRDLGPEGMRRSVVVVATSDQPSMLRLKCAMSATAVAEYFRDQGKDVLLMMDNLTRFAMAQREIGLATGEPPVSRGYTPSMYTALPKLLERTGNFGRGSITGIYAVLVEGDDTNEPISDTVRGIIDGHIILSRKIAARNHYPAIDVLGSISRLMNDIVPRDQMAAANKLRNIMAVYEQNFDLIAIGAYKKGSNPALDAAIEKIDKVNAFLQQEVGEKFSYEQTVELMKQVIA
ncbi:MAG: flagellar protein export ATPase FliI [Oscillospiraceae bacterium]|jgi:flagellum-specific ATP synthase|nr:flagellar protein export ATPase FliI [Oscillospiraceae bacterium]